MWEFFRFSFGGVSLLQAFQKDEQLPGSRRWFLPARMPKRVSTICIVYTLLVIGMGVLGVYEAHRDKASLLFVFFALIPSIFYAAFVGVLWAKLHGGCKGEPGA
jgi:hypothetical protein